MRPTDEGPIEAIVQRTIIGQWISALPTSGLGSGQIRLISTSNLTALGIEVLGMKGDAKGDKDSPAVYSIHIGERKHFYTPSLDAGASLSVQLVSF